MIAELERLEREILEADTFGPAANKRYADRIAAIRSGGGVSDAKMEAAFAKGMEGRAYGAEETRDARDWFAAGWKAIAAAPSPEPQAEPDQVLAGDGKPCTGYGMLQDGTAVCFWPSCNCRDDG